VEQKISKAKNKNKSSFKWIIFFIVVVTFIINPQFADPFNSIKLYALMVTTAILFQFLNLKNFIIKIKYLKQNQENFLTKFNVIPDIALKKVDKTKIKIIRKNVLFIFYIS
jgi:hypothetical protein